MLFSYFGFSPSRSSFSLPPASPCFVLFRREWRAAFCGGGGAGSLVRVPVALGAGIGVAVQGECAQGGGAGAGVGSWARAAVVAARWLSEGFLVLGVWVAGRSQETIMYGSLVWNERWRSREKNKTNTTSVYDTDVSDYARDSRPNA